MPANPCKSVPNPCKNVPFEARPRMERLFAAAGCRTQKELADLLGVAQGSIASTIKRGRIPDSWLLKLVLLKGANPLWILSGHGRERLEP